jgi:dethiobiotin synthetase
MSKTYFVSGIGTDVGKTVASAILCRAFEAAYWKPIQAGTVLGSDKDTVRHLCGDTQVIYDEAYALKEPLSPHTAARIESVHIDVKSIVIPKHEGTLIVEGAGGLMVPITREFMYSDWIKSQKLPVILVSRHYLGSLNHTMLSLEFIQKNEIPLVGILFIGKDNDHNEALICARYDVRNLGNLPEVSAVTPTFVQVYAEELKNRWKTMNFTDLL